MYSRRKVCRVVEQRGKNFSAIGVPAEQDQRLSHESYLDLQQTVIFGSLRSGVEKRRKYLTCDPFNLKKLHLKKKENLHHLDKAKHEAKRISFVMTLEASRSNYIRYA